jgi:hypothetical protein
VSSSGPSCARPGGGGRYPVSHRPADRTVLRCLPCRWIQWVNLGDSELLQQRLGLLTPRRTTGQRLRTHEVGPCQGGVRDPPSLEGCGLAGFWCRRWMLAAAGGKVERPAGRTTLPPARTGAGSWDEKARTAFRSWLACTHSGPGCGVRMTVSPDPGCAVRSTAVLQAHAKRERARY